MFKKLCYVAISLPILVFSFALITYTLIYPDYTLSPNNPFAEVRVYRDEYGIPHIFANQEGKTEHENLKAMFFAQGFLSAQDRLFQMEKFRRLASGRLSELAGSEALDIDKILRIMGFYEKARLVKEKQGAENLE